MRVRRRLDRLRERVEVLEFDRGSKLVLVSDCHRSNGAGADNFAKNENLYAVALRHYDKNGYTLIELGDGDELWEGRSYDDIATRYAELFETLVRLHTQGRYHMLWGNHDMVKRHEKWVRRHMGAYEDRHSGRVRPLFAALRVHEGLVLRERESGAQVFLLHGHQADLLNYDLWRVARFLVRHVWRPLELVGLRDPNNGGGDSPQKRVAVERKLVRYAGERGEAVVAGHTHRPAFPGPGEAPYFNDGSCVALRQVTALEIVRGAISMVRWVVRAREDGSLYVTRERVEGPLDLGALPQAPQSKSLEKA